MEQFLQKADWLEQRQDLRFLFAFGEHELPLYVESIGYHNHQGPMHRRDGYPYFHWLQTLEGEGEFELSGRRFVLPVGAGCLLFPGVAHAYAPKSNPWATIYVTFGGSLAESLLTSFGIRHTDWFEWAEDAPITEQLVAMIGHAQHNEDRSGLDTSAELYQLITMIKKYGQSSGRTSLFQHMEKLNPLLHWLDKHYGDPEIGLGDMAERLHVSPRYLNSLFRQSFGLTAYAYLIKLRIRKAKEMMIRGERRSIKDIALLSGYRDPSHFIAAFGKTEGMTPEQFRKLHGIMA